MFNSFTLNYYNCLECDIHATAQELAQGAVEQDQAVFGLHGHQEQTDSEREDSDIDGVPAKKRKKAQPCNRQRKRAHMETHFLRRQRRAQQKLKNRIEWLQHLTEEGVITNIRTGQKGFITNPVEFLSDSDSRLSGACFINSDFSEPHAHVILTVTLSRKNKGQKSAAEKWFKQELVLAPAEPMPKWGPDFGEDAGSIISYLNLDHISNSAAGPVYGFHIFHFSTS